MDPVKATEESHDPEVREVLEAAIMEEDSNLTNSTNGEDSDLPKMINSDERIQKLKDELAKRNGEDNDFFEIQVPEKKRRVITRPRR